MPARSDLRCLVQYLRLISYRRRTKMANQPTITPEEILAVRERHDLSQDEMGFLSGMTHRAWSEYEKGLRPAKGLLSGPVARLIRLLDALKRHDIAVEIPESDPNEIALQVEKPKPRSIFTDLQCRMARAGLGWGVRDLARRAGLGTWTITRFENGDPEHMLKADTIATIRTALEDAGVEFLGDQGVLVREKPKGRLATRSKRGPAKEG